MQRSFLPTICRFFSRLFPPQISASFTAEGRVLLFSVEVHHLLSQYSSHGGQSLGFNWYLRLCEAHHQIRMSDSSAGEGREKRREDSRRRDVSRAEADTQGPGSLSYEIRAISVGPRGGGGGGDVLCSAGPVLPPCAGYITPHAWVRCSGAVPHSVVPLKGRIEVWVLSRVGEVRAIEANQLQVTNITHTATPFRKDFGFRYYLASNSNLADQSVSERLPETNAAVSRGAVEVHQVGGDHSGWTNNLNQACSLLSITGGALSANPTSLATQVPKGFSIVRRIVCSDAGEPSGRKHTLYFHAKLSFYSTSRYSKGGDEQSEKEKEKISKTSEVRGNQGYEWRVLVAMGRGCSAVGRSEVVAEGSCPFQQADQPTHLGPWVWSGVCTELGPLHSGDEVLLVTRVVLFNHSGVKDKDMASSCSVEVSNCEIVSTFADQNEGSGSMGEFGEGRHEGKRERARAKTGSFFPSGGAVLGTIPRVPHTAHFASFNDQSLAFPIC